MIDLNKEIEKARHNIRTDGYAMSIGELASMYEDNELEIHPAFQRVFRWSEEQKSNFIESIFLGIPIPSIFVSQRQDGVWDLVDGLQRLSTILSFMNKLREENGEIREPFLPEATKYLPALKGIQWEAEDSSNSLSNNLKLLFKRQKISVNIIERESDDEAKLELFQRLNTGGSTLTPQEVRNCLLIMLNNSAFDFIQDLTKYPSFQRTVLVTESKEEQAYYYELVLRFFINRYASDEARSKHSDVHPYLNEETIRLFDANSSFDYVKEKKVFQQTFDNIAIALDEDAFKKYKTEKSKYEGGFSLPVFEALSTSVSFLVDSSLDESLIRTIIVSKSKELVENEDFKRSYSSRLRPIDRTKRMVNIGRSLFCED
ncbi:DUF262 domain-containing protein [Psychrobacter glaciei]|uniref:DUF262 domain-containing protein n=1 Tax=Psychrobacter glaciei TaxID=619771 RepID=UPI003F461BF0